MVAEARRRKGYGSRVRLQVPAWVTVRRIIDRRHIAVAKETEHSAGEPSSEVLQCVPVLGGQLRSVRIKADVAGVCRDLDYLGEPLSSRCDWS